MLERISKTIANGICQTNEFDKEVVAYGCESLLSTIVNMTLLLLIAAVGGYFHQMIVFILFFGALRMASGGYHAKNHLLCFVTYQVLSLAGIYTAMLINPKWSFPYVVFMAGVTMVLVYCFAPIACENRPLTERETLVFKKRSRRMAIVLLVLILLFVSTRFWGYAITAVHAMVIESFTLIKLPKGRRERDEKGEVF